MRAAVLALLVLLGLPGAAGAQAPSTDDATQVIVRFRPGADARERGLARSGADVRRAETLPLAQTELVDPAPGTSVPAAVAGLERDHDVLYAEPDARRSAFSVPSDPGFGQQWALQNTGQPVQGTGGTAGADINAPAAWDLTVGSRGVIVGVIDSGADLGHPDLAPELWDNPGELPGNGIDDDRDGLIDDVHGWDWSAGDAVPADGEGHGTHVAGTIGARGDDAAGVTGVAQRSSLMILRALDDNGDGTVADLLKAYAYAARKGARVVNLSFGGDTPDQSEIDAIRAAGNVLFVAAAGNTGDNDDTTGSYPCNYDLPNLICVAASDRNDALAAFSNYGARTVDLAAPGVNVLSTYKGSRYAYLSGTSMATPQVSGAAALALAAAPALTVAQLRVALLGSVRRVPAFACKLVTGGRLDAAAAVRAALAATGAPAASAPPSPSPAQGCDPAADAPPSPPAPPPPAPAPYPSAPPAAVPPPAATVSLPKPVAPPVIVPRGPAKLTVERARVTGARLDVLATITSRATGVLRVSFTNNGTTTRFDQPIPAGSRQMRITRTLSAKARRGRTGIVRLTYAGSARVRPDAVRLRAAGRRAALRRTAAAIDAAGDLIVSGTVTRRARGVVRVRMDSVDPTGGVQSTSFRAAIQGGRWAVAQPLSRAAQRAGGQLSIQYTGYGPGRIRGEQDAKAVAGRG